MGFSPPAFLLPLVFQLLGVIPGLIQQAEVAFSGQPGSGAKKKEFILASAKALIDTQEMIKADLLTAEQEAAVVDTIAEVTDAIVSAVNTAKLFQKPAV